MKMSNEELATMADSMSRLEEKGKLGYVIAYDMRKMAEESKEYIDLRNELLKKYGTSYDDGKRVKVEGDSYEKFMSELSDIAQIEHDIDILQVTPEEFYSGSLTSSQMANLMWIVKDDGKES